MMVTELVDTPKSGRPAALPPGIGAVRGWFAKRGWTPHEFQERAWSAFGAGLSGLIHVATGAGKTHAAYGGPLAAMINEAACAGGGVRVRGLRLLYITPLRAVSRDIEAALLQPVRDLELSLTVQSRTGDTTSSLRAKQKEMLPNVLVTTPESLSLMLTWPDCRERFAGVIGVIVDEWHELLTSKRGTQTELALARLRVFSPGMRTWALSATLDNLDEAAAAVVGVVGAGRATEIISAPVDRPVVIESVLPSDITKFPWAGHLGLSILPEVVEAIDPSRSTIVFTNTRSQAERWYQAILVARPEWESIAALHHGSIERGERARVEGGLKSGTVRLVVATSSLDLGVDFAPVERVFQIGSPKGIARLLQRAGRSGHRPGETCRVVCVPTHAMELVEIAAARSAVERGAIEPRIPLEKPLDVLAQHLVSCGLGGGFTPDELFGEVRKAHSYRNLTRQEFEWTLSLVREGGGTLRAYPQYHRVKLDEGRYHVPDKRLSQLHRLNVGTITSSSTIPIRYVRGKSLGSIEEDFITARNPGEKFVFAGKTVEFARLHEMVAYVRPSRGKTTHTPIWDGIKLPISESLGLAIRESFDAASRGLAESPEMIAAAPIIAAQARLSHVPSAGEVLAEMCVTREGSHLFVFPFDGRLVHGGIAALLAMRIARRTPVTLSIAANDYGFELLGPRDFDFEPYLMPDLFAPTNLAADAVASINMGELSRRQFREVARVSGLVFRTYPGAAKTARQVHASASLIYDVFREFDPDNLLLGQADREVLDRQFEHGRLARALTRLQQSPLRIVRVKRPTPLSLPLVIERVGGRLSSQSLADRVEEIKRQWDKDLSKLERAGKPRAEQRSALSASV